MLARWSDHCPNLGEVFVKVMLAVMVLLISTWEKEAQGRAGGRGKGETGEGQGKIRRRDGQWRGGWRKRKDRDKREWWGRRVNRTSDAKR